MQDFIVLWHDSYTTLSFWSRCVLEADQFVYAETKRVVLEVWYYADMGSTPIASTRLHPQGVTPGAASLWGRELKLIAQCEACPA